MLELILNKSRTSIHDISLYREDGITGVTLDTGDTVRIIGYRRFADTPVFNLVTGASVTANGSSITITTTVPTPTDTIPVVRVNFGQADLTSLISGTPLKIEITVADADGSPAGGLLGPIHGYAWVCGTSGAIP